MTNYSGDKELWPVYISIGNIDSTIRNKPFMNAWIPHAFLPIPPKRLAGVVGYTVEQQELDALPVIHKIISRILSPLFDAASFWCIEMVCCDEKVWRCVPRLTCWLADPMENATLHCVATNRCPSCIAPVGECSEIPNQAYDFRLHPSYAAAYENKSVASLREWGVRMSIMPLGTFLTFTLMN